MSDGLGLLITGIYVSVFLGLYFLKRLFIKKDQKRYRLLIIIFDWINVLLPTAFLFTLNGKWLFNDTYLPSQTPSDLIFSTFHLLMIGITLLVTVFLLKKARIDQTSTKRYFFNKLDEVDYEVLKFGVLLFGIEFYKQFFALNLINGLSNYGWYGLPLQLCSLPLYLFLIVPFISNKKIQDAFYYFLALYSLIAGLSVMISGIGVFTLDVSISLHTMIWHGTMIVVGLYIGSSKKFGQNYKQYLSATIIFLSFVVFIQIVNTIFHYLSFEFPLIATFDGFFISPWGDSTNIPLLSPLRVKMREINMPIFVIGLILSLLYALFISLVGFLVFLLYHHNYKKNENSKNNILVDETTFITKSD